ncbi:DUF4011 domain-containing anti-phage protein Hhe [Methylotuvimicrobium sp. KM1]|uniref:DUF4011 domain-containing anti-phage protein Hhe n=1 Tax=Methylotuvimicrobium sp. KM1 TaxID=3377707 RepID=UPI00384C21AE
MDFCLDSLEQIRNRLLDLTARNRLLNFSHGRGGYIRIVDELPDQLCNLLLTEEELEFLPIPEPTREQLIEAGYVKIDAETEQEVRVKKDPTAIEWAKWLNIKTDYELPEPLENDEPDKHQDKAIQTLLFPYEMETQLRSVRNKAETAIEETGANILYLAFGFLEWFESHDSDKARLAPLFLLPVTLNRGKLNKEAGTYVYTLNYTGEDILPNLSLREKLKIDYGLALPEVDETVSPEGYFAQVEHLIDVNQPRWKVRRYCTLALLNFGKLLMYLDLDPARWPEDEGNIVNHPIVQKFFASSAGGEQASSHFSAEYEIDSVSEIHEQYPLIDDADSSQHSALIDAINGKNMVIEGPPGTGKSQTITNLIAAALAQDKKVLFVAEKLAALQVVKHRLDRAGLGDFCLELHSHNTQKSHVLQNIGARLANQDFYRSPADIDADIARYEKLKQQLNDYVILINRPWKNTGQTIHEIFTRATRYREILPELDTIALHPSHFTGEMLNSEVQKQCSDQIEIHHQAYREVSNQFQDGVDLQSHPWAGVNNTELQMFDSSQVCDLLAGWNGALQALHQALSTICAAVDMKLDEVDGFDQIDQLAKDFALFSEPFEQALYGILPNLQGDNIQLFQNYIALFKTIQQLYASLRPHVQASLLEDLGQLDSLTEAQKRLSMLGVDELNSLADLAKCIHRIGRLQEKLSGIDSAAKEVGQHFGESFHRHITNSEQGIQEFQELLKLTCQLPVTLWKKRDECFDDEELDEVIPVLTNYLDVLVPIHEQINESVSLDKLPSAVELKELQEDFNNGGFFKWFKPSWRKAKKGLKRLAAKPKVKFKKIQSHLDAIVLYAETNEQMEADKRFGQLLGDHFAGLNTPINEIQALRSWYRAIRQTYGVGFGPKVALGQAILDLPQPIGKGVHSFVEQGLSDQIKDSLEEVAFLQKTFANFSALKKNDKSLLDQESALYELRDALAECLEPCQKLFKKEDIHINEMSELVANLHALRESIEKWHDSDVNQTLFNGLLDLSVGPDQDNRTELAKAEATLDLAKTVAEVKVPLLKQALYNGASAELFDKFAEFESLIKQKQTEIPERNQPFVERTKLDYQQWIPTEQNRLILLLARNDKALSNKEWLVNWLDFVRSRERVKEIGFSGLIDALESRQIQLPDLMAAYYLAVYDLIARQVIEERPELGQFSGVQHKTIQQQFCKYDEKLKALQQQKIAWKTAKRKVPAGNSGGKVSNYTELALLQHECNKKKRHVPIRQLVKRSGQALLSLKPCFMMGPMSAAQYLSPGEINFDLIIMDEASQMKPEDALGVIARGKQLVVVGDPKQLPPTSFFDKAVNDDDEDSTAIEESESILDAALPMFTARRLRWHYRSQHESLIAFSNHSFYNSDLVVFPSPHSESSDYGIKYTRVPRGKFVAQCNLEEAEVIAEAVAKHFLARPYESLGVVAMNAKQREQIERAIEDLSKQRPEFQEALELNRDSDEPLFVKNLENVQGDERDVIYISFTYGPQSVGAKVMQRFGPINSNVGWRRLNVLFTRSKKRMHIFTSMGSEDILVSERSSRGVKALKDFLAFAETGYIHQPQHTGKAPDSDFEIAVANSLRDAGFETVPQVGVAGFFIDLAVIDPGKPGRFLMGIECDGASYHSAKSARDRDRLRQSVLERLGWRIHRIWSTDWFKNPQAELQPLIRELNQLKSEVTEEVEKPSEQEDLQEIIVEHEAEEKTVEAYVTEQADLKTKLEHFDQNVIRKEQPETPANKRLLRPAMLETLLEFKPQTVWEFKEMIPPFLRQGTASNEGGYLEQVLEIIRSYDC